MYEYRIMNDANTAAKAITAYKALVERAKEPGLPG